MVGSRERWRRLLVRNKEDQFNQRHGRSFSLTKILVTFRPRRRRNRAEQSKHFVCCFCFLPSDSFLGGEKKYKQSHPQAESGNGIHNLLWPFFPPSIPTTEVDLATTRARLRPSPYIPLAAINKPKKNRNG